MHLDPAAVAAREQIEAGRPDLAARRMFALDDEEQAARFEEAAASATATYREVVEALGPRFEGGYFLYRFSDPTYLVAEAVVRAVAGAALRGGGRALDVCGGSGHLTRSLMDLSSPAPVVADFYFAKLWLARRFTAPGCEPVCCDGNAPAALQETRLRLRRLLRRLSLHLDQASARVGNDARGRRPGAVVVTHAHNALQWNPSAGMPLPPGAYRDLFEEMTPRLFAERTLLGEIVAGGPLDLSQEHAADALDADLALTIVASRRGDVWRPYPLEEPSEARGANSGSTRCMTSTLTATRCGCVCDFRRRTTRKSTAPRGCTCPRRSSWSAPPSTRCPPPGCPPGSPALARRRVVLDLPKRYY